MSCKYITIEREYGSGGTKVARKLAEETKIPCYGSEILEEVSKKLDISVERIQRYEETVTNSFLYSVYLMSQTVSGNTDMLKGEGHIYVEEQAIIKRLADSGTAIFLGHCASEALKDYKNVINVFIQCKDEEQKVNRIVEEYGIPKEQADVVRRKYDKKRANYYHVNTEKKWNDFKNYDIVLDSGKLGIDGCVKVLKSLVM